MQTMWTKTHVPICRQCGPKPMCPFCNMELIGPTEYIKATMKLAINIPCEILKRAAWIHIKYLLIRILSSTLINLIHQETTPYSGLLIRLMTTIKRYTQNQDEHTGGSKKVHVTQKRGPNHRKRKKPKKAKNKS